MNARQESSTRLQSDVKEELVLRHPESRDGAQIHALVAACPPLDTNTVYAYLLQAEYFADTCIAAYRQKKLVGFISAFVVPQRTDTLFVWQVAVHASERGQGLAARMLDHLLQEQIAKGIRYIEVTVSPDNKGSRALFNAFARRKGVALNESPLFDSHSFGGLAHEDEPLLRLGPFQ